MGWIKGANLRAIYESKGATATLRLLKEAMQTGKLKPTEFSLLETAQAFCGEAWVKALHPMALGGGNGLIPVEEAGEAVDVTAFRNITGQIVYTVIREQFSLPAFIADQLVETVPTRLDGEKIASAGNIGDDVPVVEPGMPYPHAGFGEDFIETPSTDKHGMIVAVTREAIFFDRTATVMRRAGQVGERLGLRKEKEILDLVIGATTSFKFRGTTFATYEDTDGSGWSGVGRGGGVNLVQAAARELIDWTDIDEAEQLWDDILDSDTGEPLPIMPDTLLVPAAKKFVGRRIMTAAEVRSTEGVDQEMITGNPLAGDTVRVLSSSLLKKRLVDALGKTSSEADKVWFLGMPRKAFAYMENWPLTVSQAPQNSEAEFERDIVLRWKASERGKAAVMEPRYMLRLDGHA